MFIVSIPKLIAKTKLFFVSRPFLDYTLNFALKNWTW